MPDENAVTTRMPETGEAFDPTVWIESLASILASFLADPRLRYAQGVQPNVVDGEMCLLVATWLASTDPAAYDHVMEFARANQVRVQEDRRTGERAIQKYA